MQSVAGITTTPRVMGDVSTDAMAATRVALSLQTLENTNHAETYAAETRDLLQVLATLGARSPAALTRIMFRSLLGDPVMVADLMRTWLRSLQRFSIQVTMGQVLWFLAVAPLDPCIRDHCIGGRERHAVYFLPFGCTSPLSAALQFRVGQADVRFIRALQLLLANYTVFPQCKQDPNFGFWTYSAFRYTLDAQQIMDELRPVFVASAFRAVGMQLRIDIGFCGTTRLFHGGKTPASSSRTGDVRLGTAACMQFLGKTFAYSRGTPGILPRARKERLLLQRPVEYAEAVAEQGISEQIWQQIQKVGQQHAGTQRSDSALLPQIHQAFVKLGNQLLRDSFQFVFRERSAKSLPPRLGSASQGTVVSCQYLPTHPYAVLPSADQVLEFGRQTIPTWTKQLRIAKNMAAMSTTIAVDQHQVGPVDS